MVAKYQKDIDLFKGYVYEVVRVIANEWFKILDKIGSLNEFKK